MLGPEGIHLLKGKLKSIVEEMQGEISSSSNFLNTLSNLLMSMTEQQVIDLFRDRLEFVQGEFAEAKNKICDLEREQSQSNSSLRLAAERLGHAGKYTSLQQKLSFHNECISQVINWMHWQHNSRNNKRNPSKS